VYTPLAREPARRRGNSSRVCARCTAEQSRSTKSSDERLGCLRLSKYATGTLGGRAGCIPAPTPFSGTTTA